eukprot:gene5731-11588_t
MGASQSNLASAYSIAKEWPWGRVLNIIHNYRNDEYDFVIDKVNVMKLTGCEEVDAEGLITDLPADESGNINAIALLIAIVLVSHSTQLSNQPTLACNVILGQNEAMPAIPMISRITANAFENCGKRSNTLISKDEFLAWSQELLDTLPSITYESIIGIMKNGNAIISTPSRDKEKDKKTKKGMHKMVSDITIDPAITLLEEEPLEDPTSKTNNKVIILKRYSNSKKLEVSVLLNADDSEGIIATSTSSIEDIYDNYAFLCAENDDILLIKKSGTKSNMTETSTLLADSKYSSSSHPISIALPESDDSCVYLWTHNRDLMMIQKRNTESQSRCIEVNILSNDSNYQDFTLRTSTSLPEVKVESRDKHVFLLAPNLDLYMITKPKPSSSTTTSDCLHIRVLSQSSDYDECIMEMDTISLPNFIGNESILLDMNLNIILVRHTTMEDVGDVIEVQTLSASSNYQSVPDVRRFDISMNMDADGDASYMQMCFLNAMGGQCEFAPWENSDSDYGGNGNNNGNDRGEVKVATNGAKVPNVQMKTKTIENNTAADDGDDEDNKMEENLDKARYGKKQQKQTETEEDGSKEEEYEEEFEN